MPSAAVVGEDGETDGMKVIAIRSGSSGNCIFVEAGGVRLFLDAGISGRQAEQTLRSVGRQIRAVDALIISHDHRDHARGIGVFQRKFGLPVYITRGTLTVASGKENLGKLTDIRHFISGGAIEIGDLRVETIPTPHDAVDGVAFVVDDGRRRLGVMTDLGHVFAGLPEIVASLDAVLIESNHDPQMLAEGPYPEALKRRIRGEGGHLSNAEAADLVAGARARLQWACLAHLSGQNNHPQVALQTHRARLGNQFPLYVAGRDAATAVLEL